MIELRIDDEHFLRVLTGAIAMAQPDWFDITATLHCNANRVALSFSLGMGPFTVDAEVAFKAEPALYGRGVKIPDIVMQQDQVKIDFKII